MFSIGLRSALSTDPSLEQVFWDLSHSFVQSGSQYLCVVLLKSSAGTTRSSPNGHKCSYESFLIIWVIFYLTFRKKIRVCPLYLKTTLRKMSPHVLALWICPSDLFSRHANKMRRHLDHPNFIFFHQKKNTKPFLTIKKKCYFARWSLDCLWHCLKKG